MKEHAVKNGQSSDSQIGHIGGFFNVVLKLFLYFLFFQGKYSVLRTVFY